MTVVAVFVFTNLFGIDAGDILASVHFDFPADLRFPGEYDSYILKHSKKLFIKWLNSALSGDINLIKQMQNLR